MKAVYAGSFDPITLGHIDIIIRALKICDLLVVAVGDNTSKTTVFTANERVALASGELTNIYSRIQVCKFNGLLVDFCESINADVIIRGLRAVSDFEYELQISNANRDLNPEVMTIWLPTQPKYSYISSSLVKEIVKNGGDVSRYLPEAVALALQEKIG